MSVETHDARRRLLAPREVARRWGVSQSTLRRWAQAGIGPQPVRLSGGTVRYLTEQVEEFERALAGGRR